MEYLPMKYLPLPPYLFHLPIESRKLSHHLVFGDYSLLNEQLNQCLNLSRTYPLCHRWPILHLQDIGS